MRAHGGAMSVLRRGLQATPELRRGLVVTAFMAIAAAAGRIVVPIAIQQILDKGFTDDGSLRGAFVLATCTAAVVVVLAVAVLARATYLRLVVAAEGMLRTLRVKVFAHIHRLSIADLDEDRRGALTSRVTSDIETIARFAQWGGIAWVVDTAIIVGVLATISVYSWQLALVAILVFAPMIPMLRALQRRQLAAYGVVRTRVGETLSEISESVMGADALRAYGSEGRMRSRLRSAIGRQYMAERRAARFSAAMFPLGDVFGGLGLAAVVVVGTTWGPGWGLEAGTLIAIAFLVTLALGPIAELAEIVDMTQTAFAGWRKVLDVLDMRPDVAEPTSGVHLPSGPLSIRAESVSYRYRGSDELALRDVDLTVPAGTAVAIVGETGSGKSTLAKLLCRLADPTSGRLLLDGVELTQVAPESRHSAIRLVPQDGFLFDGTIAENVAMGSPGPTSDAELEEAFARLGLADWLRALPKGLQTRVGQRGEQLSVGERQLVALARVQQADPGLLVLDEATSAVDPETDRALSTALERLSEGRTTVTIAHRLSTAESADVVFVFDGGRLVQQGSHAELLAVPGRYRDLHESWLGGTRTSSPDASRTAAGAAFSGVPGGGATFGGGPPRPAGGSS